ncbi:MAG: hypothetical protein HN352_05510 [Bacteroidetes bacterium]|jgi:hypothetical protein|nr:hypothetical protein [Bacteroidota bacterium]MBT3747362.1 hypothetical protein [Bacteroidota bacterium]MBT4400854.1 hypothetical protein [Bacteroidota bacterium]MBT4409537.1 hypothetical protein [Bacteroidota bacterium]MBT5427236.1 hypothetical protein [Bacteroidota bacterium]
MMFLSIPVKMLLGAMSVIEAMEEWLESDGHYRNLMNCKWQSNAGFFANKDIGHQPKVDWAC